MPIKNWPPEQVEFYATLGAAIGQWVHVERALFFVFTSALTEVATSKYAPAFFAVINFNAKLKMVDATIAAEFYGENEILAKWANLLNRLGKRARIRNALAHNQVHYVKKDGKTVFSLVTPYYDPNPTYAGNQSSLSLADIKAAAAKFRECEIELDDFANVLRGEKPLGRGRLTDDLP